MVTGEERREKKIGQESEWVGCDVGACGKGNRKVLDAGGEAFGG
jgi:hypothetical protein